MKKETNKTEIPLEIQRALESPVDYSQAFTFRVESISRALCSALGKAIKHDADMSYRAGQYLSFLVSDKQQADTSRSPSVEVRVYVSSKGKFFAIYCFDLASSFMPAETTINHPISPQYFPAFLERTVTTCRIVASEFEYTEVEYSLFRQLAPGCLTEMDGQPATIFEALFAEVV